VIIKPANRRDHKPDLRHQGLVRRRPTMRCFERYAEAAGGDAQRDVMIPEIIPGGGEHQRRTRQVMEGRTVAFLHGAVSKRQSRRIRTRQHVSSKTYEHPRHRLQRSSPTSRSKASSKFAFQARPARGSEDADVQCARVGLALRSARPRGVTSRHLVLPTRVGRDGRTRPRAATVSGVELPLTAESAKEIAAGGEAMALPALHCGRPRGSDCGEGRPRSQRDGVARARKRMLSKTKMLRRMVARKAAKRS